MAGEWIFQVDGLPFAPMATAYAGAGYPAVQLFVQGARRVRPDFDPAVEAVAINRICQLVDGSPLAIELAARWAQVLSCAEIADRLGHVPGDEVAALLDQARAVQNARSLALADVIRYYGLLALTQAQQGDDRRALEAAQTAARLTRRNRLAGVWTLEGFAGVAEV